MIGRRALWTRFAIVAIAVTWSVAAVVAHCWIPQVRTPADHPDHPLATAVGAEFTVNVSHPHLSDNSTPPCAVEFATDPLILSNTTVFAPDAAAAAAWWNGRPADLAVPGGRGPPGALGLPRTGQELLTRFCLSRR